MKHLMIAMAGILLLLTACGHKTDLERPEQPSVHVQTPTPVAEAFDRLPSGPM